MEESSVCQAARGAAIVVHAANPPGYRGWSRLVLPMLANVIAAAQKNHARIVLPGTLYNYDPAAGPDLSEAASQNPKMRKGKIRVAMQQRLKQAASDGVRTLIVRFGDFFGPQPGNSWFSQALIKPGRPAWQILYPGENGVGHAWAYLPDVGEVLALLAERERELPVFESFHFDGHWDPDGSAMTSHIASALEDPQLPIRRFPWSIVQLAAPFNETLRELAEVRPLWTKPLRLTNAKLISFLGSEPRTPLNIAISETLKGLGVTRRTHGPGIAVN
jgi:nucleoside-diphosphate-sugar epimerase